MEEFGARSELPLETCIREVLESDIYIGIIGIRYGSIDKETGKSFTQLEYEAAVDNNKEILIYLLDEENSKITPAHIDYVNIINLNNFKKSLKEKHTIDIFSTEEELADKINKRLNKITKEKIVIRPKAIKAKVYKFNTDKEKYVVFIGYINNKPSEFWIASSDDFYTPPWVKKGSIIKQQTYDEEIRYDFQFLDNEGYEIIIQGLSRSFSGNCHEFGKHVSRLFQLELNKDELIDLVSTIPYFESDEDQFKSEVIKILKKI